MIVNNINYMIIVNNIYLLWKVEGLNATAHATNTTTKINLNILSIY